MQPGQPSVTAMAAALYRAAHQVLDGGRVFSDPLALRILGADEAIVRQRYAEMPSRDFLRGFIAARTRFAEDALARAVARDTRQLVVLGAGLDTYAYRAPLADGMRVFEVDHPATQAWKRERLAEAAIAVPDAVVYAPVDFERETLADGLGRAGFRPTEPSFFTWLGVTPYLEEATVFATLGFIAALPGRGEVVFDYANPPQSVPPEEGRAEHEALAARVAAVGERFKSWLDTDALAARLRRIGFVTVEDLGPRDIAARFFGRESTRGNLGGHMVHAAR